MRLYKSNRAEICSLSVMCGERIERRSLNMTAHIFAGHAVNSGMTVTVEVGSYR